jgi:hypothetical protein
MKEKRRFRIERKGRRENKDYLLTLLINALLLLGSEHTLLRHQIPLIAYSAAFNGEPRGITISRD